MIRKTDNCFFTAVSDKDFIFGVFSKNEFNSIDESIGEDSPIGSGSCNTEPGILENEQNEDPITENLH